MHVLLGQVALLRRDRTRPQPPLERVDRSRANVCRHHFHVRKQTRETCTRNLAFLSSTNLTTFSDHCRISCLQINLIMLIQNTTTD